MENVFYLFLGALFTLAGFFTNWFKIRQEKLDNYKILSLEKRLDIHQKAYALTFDIQKAANPEKYDAVFNKVHQWWSENNFYLEPKARKAFKDFYWELLIFQTKTTNPGIVQRRMHFHKTLLPNARKLLTEEIGLTWLGNEEIDSSSEPQKSPAKSD
ncbi:MAG: hypothetical protein P8Y60_04635 [Calditrichota bacterium]|jgi:hypothetical protein